MATSDTNGKPKWLFESFMEGYSDWWKFNVDMLKDPSWGNKVVGVISTAVAIAMYFPVMGISVGLLFCGAVSEFFSGCCTPPSMNETERGHVTNYGNVMSGGRSS